jgi:hypothetical protein
LTRFPAQRLVVLGMLAMSAGLPRFDMTGRQAAQAAPPSSVDDEAATRRPERPRMQSLAPSSRGGVVPSQRALVDARATFRQRYGNPAARARTSTATLLVAEALLAEATDESDPAVKWVILDEARKLAISAGSPQIIGRAVRIASSEFDFDALNVEYRSLLEIPLRALEPGRASELAMAAEGIATRAEIDRSFDQALLAQGLSIRAWQRAGNIDGARTATKRLEALEQTARTAKAQPRVP